MLVAAVADPIAISSVDDSRLNRREMNIVRLDQIGPLRANPFCERIETGGEAFRTAEDERRRVQVVRQIRLAISLADGGDVRLEHRARGGDLIGRRGEERRGNQKKKQCSGLESHAAIVESAAPVL